MTLAAWIGIGFLGLALLCAFAAVAGAGRASRMEERLESAGMVMVGRWSVHRDCVVAFRETGDPQVACEWPCRVALWRDPDALSLRIPARFRPAVES